MRASAIKKKEHISKCRHLENSVSKFTIEYNKNPTLENRRALEQEKLLYNSLFTLASKRSLQKLKWRHYERGEQACSLRCQSSGS